MPVRMATATKGGNRPATNLNCKAGTIACSKFPELGSGPGWVIPNHACQLTMVVQNCSPVDMQIPRGTKMCVLENIQGEQMMTLDGKKIIEQIECNKNTPDKPTVPLSLQEQK